MTAQIRITAHVARRLLRDVVAETGPAYVTPGMCMYPGLDGQPRCLVGRVLHRAGVTLGELQYLDSASPTVIQTVRMPARVSVTWPARRVLAVAQNSQDWGNPWGQVLDAALAVRPWQVTA